MLLAIGKGMLFLIVTVLLLLLFLLLLLLFVPVRYRLNGSFVEEKPDGTAELSWLCRAVSAEITYHHGVAASGAIKLFGFRIFRIRGKRV